MTYRSASALLALALLCPAVPAAAQEQIVRADLAYGAPGDGRPVPDFSPKGTQVALAPLATRAAMPIGALRPAKSGLLRIGPDQKSWIPVLATASADCPKDLCRIYLDRNRNGIFADDGAPVIAKPAQNEKTRAWWSSFNKIEVTLPYTASKAIEPYLLSIWIVRDDSLPTPDILRYSVGSWRQGSVTVNGVPALVAAMDGDNNALFDKKDSWSVIGAGEKNAPKAVLSSAEARGTSRLMFVPSGDRELVLEFRAFSPDGRSIDFAVIDKPVTRASDRAPDDLLKDERPRPRATAAFSWEKSLEAALAKAKAEGKKVFIDFETTWCGPCHTMDQWIWTDQEVAAKLNAEFIGVKLDGDIAKAQVKTYDVTGYPTMVIADPNGAVLQKVSGYLSSKEVLALLDKR